VLSPNIHAGIEQPDNLTRFGIEAGNIRFFMAIAVSTSQRKITFNCFAAVLLSTHVIHLKGQGERRLRERTIFAAVSGSFSNSPRQFPVHCWLEGACFNSRRATDCITAKRLPICR